MFSAGSQQSGAVATGREALLAIAERSGRHGNCTLGASAHRLDEGAPSGPERGRGLVWRPRFGWVASPLDNTTHSAAA